MQLLHIGMSVSNAQEVLGLLAVDWTWKLFRLPGRVMYGRTEWIVIGAVMRERSLYRIII
jgi:hypothetical protein